LPGEKRKGNLCKWPQEKRTGFDRIPSEEGKPHRDQKFILRKRRRGAREKGGGDDNVSLRKFKIRDRPFARGAPKKKGCWKPDAKDNLYFFPRKGKGYAAGRIKGGKKRKRGPGRDKWPAAYRPAEKGCATSTVGRGEIFTRRTRDRNSAYFLHPEKALHLAGRREKRRKMTASPLVSRSKRPLLFRHW